MEEDIRKTFETVTLVQEGGLEFQTVGPVELYKGKGTGEKGEWVNTTKNSLYDLMNLWKGEEIANLFSNLPDVPYETIGGLNIEATYSHLNRVATTALFRNIEKKGGVQLVDSFRRGFLDEQLYEIEAYVAEYLEKTEGVSGTMTEDLRQKLNVGEDAWKVYDVIQESLKMSDKAVLDSGYVRRPRTEFSLSIQVDPHRVLQVSAREFQEDLLKWAKVSNEWGVVQTGDAAANVAEELYRNYYEGLSRKYETYSSISDISSVVDKQRNLRFVDAKAKIAFSEKYGGHSPSRLDTLKGVVWRLRAEDRLQCFQRGDFRCGFRFEDGGRVWMAWDTPFPDP